MAELQRIEDLTEPPVVGQQYLVPTVKYPWFGKVDAWPVMGPKHSDIEHIGFELEHYHVDIRFLSEVQVRRIEREAYGRSIWDIAASAVLSTRDEPEHPATVTKRRTCRRLDHAYPIYGARRQRWYPGFAAAYAGRRCGRNAARLLVCPHKGFALGSLKPDADGRVVCPLHGLVIDTKAGAVAEHNEMPEARHVG